MLKWYVVQTKPTSEDIVSKHFERDEMEFFLPRIRSLVRGFGRHYQRIKPLFPSYLFARLDDADPRGFQLVRYTRGVRRIIGTREHPIPLDDSVIDLIKGRVSDKDVIEQQFKFKAGDMVRVSYGPLADLVGILEKPVSADGRVKVLLNLIGKRVKMEMPCVTVEKIMPLDAGFPSVNFPQF